MPVKRGGRRGRPSSRQETDMRRLLVALAALLTAFPVLAQSRVVCDQDNGTCAVDGTRQNFQSNRRGTQGTYGNRNFEIDPQSYGQASGHIGGRSISNQAVRPSVTDGNVGATQSRCYADGDGNTFCQ
jgi:hypothetical protein